jgi:hypothetical protein
MEKRHPQARRGNSGTPEAGVGLGTPEPLFQPDGENSGNQRRRETLAITLLEPHSLTASLLRRHGRRETYSMDWPGGPSSFLTPVSIHESEE